MKKKKLKFGIKTANAFNGVVGLDCKKRRRSH
jgi:hypothetical protein